MSPMWYAHKSTNTDAFNGAAKMRILARELGQLEYFRLDLGSKGAFLGERLPELGA